MALALQYSKSQIQRRQPGFKIKHGGEDIFIFVSYENGKFLFVIHGPSSFQIEKFYRVIDDVKDDRQLEFEA